MRDIGQQPHDREFAGADAEAADGKREFDKAGRGGPDGARFGRRDVHGRGFGQAMLQFTLARHGGTAAGGGVVMVRDAKTYCSAA